MFKFYCYTINTGGKATLTDKPHPEFGNSNFRNKVLERNQNNSPVESLERFLIEFYKNAFLPVHSFIA